MERDAIVMILMLLLVVSALDSTVAVTPTVTDIIDSSKYIISQTEMNIYELVTPAVNSSYTQDLARNLFGLADVLPEEEDGRYIVKSGNRTFEVDSRDGSLWYANYDKLWNVALGTDLPSPGTSYEMAGSWLSDNTLLPDNAVFVNIGSTNVSAFNIDDGRAQAKVLQYHVNYEFVIDDIPVTGEAAQISVIIGDGVSLSDRIVGVSWKWREPKSEPYAKAEMIEYESILEANGISPSDVLNHRLVYTIDDDPENAKLLYPVWEIEFTDPEYEQGVSLHYFKHFYATIFDPEVEIVTPSGAYVALPGETISFDCNVKWGTPPYTYEWSSDHDGVLSTSKSFSTSFLSEVIKMDTHVPHAIAIRVRDSENRACSDVVKVTIEPGDFNPDITITLVAAGAIGVLLLSIIVFRRRKVLPILFFLLMMFSAFVFLPVTSAGSEVDNTPVFIPSAPTGAYDDGVKEIGIEWVGLSHSKPLWWTETNIEGWYNKMGTTGGFNREFNWGEYSAWEEDFKDAQFSGTDTQWIDAVDFVYYQDHGGPDGVSFTSNHDDHGLNYWHMRLGDGDLDSIVFDACSPLAWQNSTGHDVFQRWAPAMQGIHQVCSFGTSSKNSATRGTKFATYMTDLGMTIVSAWFRACEETEPSDHTSAVFYATKSSNPYAPQLDDPINDHAYGFGYVCSDPKPGEYLYYVYIVSSC